MLQTIKVAAGIIVQEDKVFIARRSKGKFQGKWEFPGGKIEQGETAKKALKRELKEELRIDVKVGNFCDDVIHDFDTFSVHLLAYYCTINHGTIEMFAHDQYKWIPIKQLLDVDFLEADIPIAKKIKDDFNEA